MPKYVEFKVCFKKKNEAITMQKYSGYLVCTEDKEAKVTILQNN